MERCRQLSALWDEQEKDNKLNLIKGNAELIDTERSYIHTTHRMVSLIGMEDTVVIETKDQGERMSV